MSQCQWSLRTPLPSWLRPPRQRTAHLPHPCPWDPLLRLWSAVTVLCVLYGCPHYEVCGGGGGVCVVEVYVVGRIGGIFVCVCGCLCLCLGEGEG